MPIKCNLPQFSASCCKNFSAHPLPICQMPDAVHVQQPLAWHAALCSHHNVLSASGCLLSIKVCISIKRVHKPIIQRVHQFCWEHWQLDIAYCKFSAYICRLSGSELLMEEAHVCFHESSGPEKPAATTSLTAVLLNNVAPLARR